MTQELPSILENYPLSPAQREAAVTRGVDIAVRAGAGTGKTRTLVGRYLALLSHGRDDSAGIPLRNIVAMTFTNKAAREMRNRVRQEITTYLEQPNLSLEERRFWETRQTGLDAARISTIHGICGEILRAHPAEAGVDPRFDLLDETVMAILKRDTVEAALAWASSAAEMQDLLEVLTEKALVELISDLIDKRDAVDESLRRLPEGGPWQVWEERLAAEKMLALKAINQNPKVQAAIQMLKASHPTNSNGKQAINRQIILDFFSTNTESQFKTVNNLILIKMGGGTPKNWSDGEEEFKNAKACITLIRDILKKDGLLNLSLNEVDRVWAGLLPQLKQLFVVITRIYQEKKDRLEALDFDDLEKRAVDLLENYPAVRGYWQGQVRALLVDEFQDTNERQLRLVRLLAPDPGKLFIVGDAKQSIYRFRGADVTVFKGEEEKILAAGGRSISLDTSYRAHEELLEGMNSLLRPVLGDAGEHRRPYEAPFERLNAGNTPVQQGVAAPHVEFQVSVGSKPAGLESAARGLVSRLQDLVAQSTLGWGDVAILCRSSAAFATYEDVLEEANIPYLTLSGRGFIDRPEIRDMLNALRAINDPHDNISVVGLLRSPACGLTDVELYHLLGERKREQSLWDLLKTEIFWPDGVDRAKLGHAVGLIEGLNQQVGRTTAADVFKSFLDQTNYRAKLRAAGLSRSLRNVSKLLADMQTSELISLSAFLEMVEEIKDSGTREGEARSTAEGAVQLMTIHASKGLEFPVVVLGDAGAAGPKGGRFQTYPHLWIMFPGKLGGKRYVNLENEESGILKLAKALEKQEEAAERDRILYVALTRAEQMLMINGHMGKTSKGEFTAQGWLKELGELCELTEEIPADYDADGDHNYEIGCMLGEIEIGGNCVEPNFTLNRLEPDKLSTEAGAFTDVNPQMIGSYAQPAQDLSDDEPETPNRVWQVVPTAQRPTAPAWVVGSIVHEALAQWRFPTEQADQTADFDRWASARGREYGLTSQEQIRHGVGRAKKLLNGFQNSPIYAEIATADRRLHELPYVWEDDEGVIDLLIESDGVWTIIDFKTDRIQDDEAQQTVIERYGNQLERYKSAVEGLVGQVPAIKLVLLAGADGVVQVDL